MDEEKAKVEVQKIWVSVLEHIEKLGKRLETKPDFKPDGMLLFFFRDGDVATIGRGTVDTYAILAWLAENSPNVVKLGEVRLPDKPAGVV